MGAVASQDFPVWTPDGRAVVFAGTENGKLGFGIYRHASDGSAAPEVLLEGDGLEKHPYSISPDGNELFYAGWDDFMALPLTKKAAPRVILPGLGRDMPALSPDGRWLAHEGPGGSGTTEVFVQPYPPTGGQIQISSGGGSRPVWTRDGKRVFFRRGIRVFSVALGATAAFEHSPPVLFAEIPGLRGFDLTRDGREVIAVVRPSDTGIVRQISIVTNWLAQLERLVPAGGKSR
jgi:Tol biopolymer transport system component